MKTVRIFAVGVDDEKNKCVLIGQIDESGYLNPDVESFGYVTDVEIETDQWTKSIFQLTKRNDTGLMFYGDNTYDPTTTNIFSKPLKVGELFTVFYDHDDPETNKSVLSIRTITDY